MKNIKNGIQRTKSMEWTYKVVRQDQLQHDPLNRSSRNKPDLLNGIKKQT